MKTHRPILSLAAAAAAALSFTLSGCGGGNAEAPPDNTVTAVAAGVPVVTITNNVPADTATGPITFTFSFNVDVGVSFTADDVVVVDGGKGAFTRTGASWTLVVTPAANSAGTVSVTVPAGAVSGPTGAANAAVTAQKAFDTRVVAPPPPPTGDVVLADFDAVLPPVAGFEGAEGSAVAPCPVGGGTGNCFMVLRSGGQVFALGIIETTVPITATRRTISAQVFSPTAGIPMVLKIEGPGGANSGDVAPNEAVVAGWQTLTWTFAGVDPSQTFNKIVLLPNLGTVDAPPGKAYYFDAMTLVSAAAPPPSGTVLANFDDVTPPVAGFEGAEGSAVSACPAGGGAGNCFNVLRSGGQVFALGIIETTVPITATRRTISAQVFSPTAGIPMVLKLEGPGGANSGDVMANQTVVAGWQTLTWTFTGIDLSKTYNKMVLLPNLGTVDAPPGKTYAFDAITLIAAAAPPATVLANFDDVSPPVAGFEGGDGSAVGPCPAGGGSGNCFNVLRSGGQVFALGIIETAVPVAAGRLTISAQVNSPTAGIPMVLKLEGPGGANSGDVAANEAVVAGWQTLTWTFTGIDLSKTYNKMVLLPNLGTVDAPPGKTYAFDDIRLLGASGGGGGSGPLTFSTGFGTGNRTVQGGEFGGFSGSNLDGFGCSGDPAFCGSGGDFAPGVAAADSFFFYYYQTPSPATDLYMGIYVQAPGVTGGFSPSVDTPGVQVGSQTTLKFKLGQNPEWFASATKNFMIVMDLGKRYTVGATTDCRLQLRRVVVPTAAAATEYTIPLSSFALVQDCGGAVTSVAAALAASPISQIAFQGVGGGIALSDGARTSGANLSVPVGGVYPTTVVLVGGITIE